MLYEKKKDGILVKGLLVIVFYPSSHKYKLSLRKRDKRISSSVDCETDISALSLVYINELLRLGNYKPADRGRAQKKTLHYFFSPSSAFAAVRQDDRLYLRMYAKMMYTYVRIYMYIRAVTCPSLLIHNHCVYFG